MPAKPESIANQIYDSLIQSKRYTRFVLMGMSPDLEIVQGIVVSKSGGEICLSQEGGRRTVILHEKAIMSVIDLPQHKPTLTIPSD